MSRAEKNVQAMAIALRRKPRRNEVVHILKKLAEVPSTTFTPSLLKQTRIEHLLKTLKNNTTSDNVKGLANIVLGLTKKVRSAHGHETLFPSISAKSSSTSKSSSSSNPPTSTKVSYTRDLRSISTTTLPTIDERHRLRWSNRQPLALLVGNKKKRNRQDNDADSLSAGDDSKLSSHLFKARCFINLTFYFFLIKRV